MQRYNDKQKRNDRKIENYLEHIQKGKQEKPFYEIIVQVGNKNDMGVNTHNKELSKAILDEYMKEFQKRNPYLYVFNAHLHIFLNSPIRDFQMFSHFSQTVISQVAIIQTDALYKENEAFDVRFVF